MSSRSLNVAPTWNLCPDSEYVPARTEHPLDLQSGFEGASASHLFVESPIPSYSGDDLCDRFSAYWFSWAMV